MPRHTYTANLSNGETLTVEAVSGPKAIQLASQRAPEGVSVRSVVKEIPMADVLDRYPTVCGECGVNTKHSLTKIVSREIPYPAGTVIFFGMPTTEEMRVCQTHEVVTNWPKRDKS